MPSDVLVFKTRLVFNLVFLLMLTTQLEITREASALLFGLNLSQASVAFCIQSYFR